MAKLKIVVFDCDGVILESVNVKTDAFAATVSDHGPEAQQRFIEYHLQNGGVSRFEKFRWFYREILNREITDQEMDVLTDSFVKHAIDGVLKAPSVPGALKFIKKNQGRWPMYVCSGAPQDELTELFRIRDFTRLFKEIHGSPTPKAENLQMIVEKAGVAPKQALMIGDSHTDLEAAEKVGTLFYGRGDFPGHPCHSDLTRLQDFVDSL